MSEVDRLSTSGMYPTLPIAQKRQTKDDSQGPGAEGRRNRGRDQAGGIANERDPKHDASPQSGLPASQIDEYA